MEVVGVVVMAVVVVVLGDGQPLERDGGVREESIICA